MAWQHAIVFFAALAAWSGSAWGANQSWNFTVKGQSGWQDSGIDVKPGDLFRFEAQGSIQVSGAKQECGPDGLPRAWTDLIRILPLNDSGRGALVGKIGDATAARPFLIGAQRDSRIPIQGRLFLALNIAGGDTATGEFKVKITRVEKGEASKVVAPSQLPQLTAEQWSQIPARVSDPQGTEGDRVNFVILGDEDQVKSALQAVGWVIVDRTPKESVLRGILGSLSKQAYVTMPMSELQLFGRGQDYGFAMADPLIVIASRHHFRIWKAPFTADGQQVWIGAGTHDIGFDRDQRNNGITHKIDPDTDKEREYIGDTLKQSGEVLGTSYFTPRNPLTNARTAHGEDFHSDGRILMIYLKKKGNDLSERFGKVFCGVLAQNNPDGGDWGACDQWVAPAISGASPLPNLANTYRLLVVPGVMNTCVSDTPAYEDGRKVLADKYGWTAEILAVPNSSSEENAKQIADYLKDKMNGPDKRKYIVLGYSKGTPDLQVMLATIPESRNAVAAFLSIAGASGGSPIADSIPGKVDKYLEYSNRASCKGDLAAGLQSLRQDVRKRFLQAYPGTYVPTYSVVALSDESNTSKGMMSAWKLLSTYDRQTDGQLLKGDAIIPGSKYLGAARADHLAVALAFDKNPQMASTMDKARYPRTTLLEAALRTVLSDLGVQ